MKSVKFLGLTLFNGNIDEAVKSAINLAGRNKSSLIVTPNVDHLMRLDHDPMFRSIYGSADLQFLDSQPLNIIYHLFKGKRAAPVHRITGVDFTYALCAGLENTAYSMCIIGGTEQAAQDATQKLREKYPRLLIEEPIVPPYASSSDTLAWAMTAVECKRRKATFYLVCLGSPKQEIISKNILMPNMEGVFVCVGAAVDFAADKCKRAPLIVQKVGFEWAWRLLGEPRRLWRRYFRNLYFLVTLAAKYALIRR